MTRLAPDIIKITLNDSTVVLRPSLRAAYRLNLKFGGFQHLATAIIGGDLRAMADLIDEAGDRPTAIVDLVRDLAVNGNERVACLREPLLTYLGQLVGVDECTDTPEIEAPAQGGKLISRAEHYDRLFAIGTGWLNWTPAETWAATPAEIETAYAGRLDLLKAIFGSSESEKRQERQTIPFSQRAKATIAALGGKVVKRHRKAGD